MIEELLPAGVAAAEAYDDPAEARLLPAEEALVGGAVEKRRREFTTGRHLARRALAELGVPPVALLAGPRREPRWPDGTVGSITHCAGYRAAVAARAGTLLSTGIDAEPNEPLPAGVLDSIALPEERSRVAELLRREPAVRWDRLLFSIKESVYKAWYPLTGRWLDFEEADVTVDPAAGTFRARLLVPPPALPDGRPLGGFTGRWLARRGLVLAAIAVPVAGPPAARRPADPAGARPASG
ncbi:4'-phosphopantetheinyl transferase superfamily protein [Micromonospora sp. NPDC050495]|uniref:4'-phosphopantetheinyl transferase family protein n=1 Tax=Micromonospora sp. NPDC050495 TaxID=3154936 RepID=UPI0033C05B0D